MAFTISHAAAVVPLARRGLVSALIVGSMSPDFEYFLLLSPYHGLGHSAWGIPLFCVPAGLLFLMLFHRVLKRPLVALLPVLHQERLLPLVQPFRFFPAGRLARIVVSLAVGAASHLLWDSVTHRYAWTVSKAPFLAAELFCILGRPFALCELLQYATSVVGVLALLYWYADWFKRAGTTAQRVRNPLPCARRALILMGMALGAGCLALVYGVLLAGDMGQLEEWRLFAVRVVVSGMAFMYLELVLFAAVMRVGLYGVERRRQCVSS